MGFRTVRHILCKLGNVIDIVNRTLEPYHTVDLRAGNLKVLRFSILTAFNKESLELSTSNVLAGLTRCLCARTLYPGESYIAFVTGCALRICSIYCLQLSVSIALLATNFLSFRSYLANLVITCHTILYSACSASLSEPIYISDLPIFFLFSQRSGDLFVNHLMQLMSMGGGDYLVSGDPVFVLITIIK